MPSELTWRTAAWYVVDRERDVWLESLGTNGPVGHRVFALSVGGRQLPFEVDERAVVNGVRVQQVSAFGYSHKARTSHGIDPYPVGDDDASKALEELAVEGMLALELARAHRIGFTPDDLPVRLLLGDGLRRLSDYGYSDGVLSEVEQS